jgi:hypothetical protein
MERREPSGGWPSAQTTARPSTVDARARSSGLPARAGTHFEEIARTLPGEEEVEDERIQEGDQQRASEDRSSRAKHVDHRPDEPERRERDRKVETEPLPRSSMIEAIAYTMPKMSTPVA